MSTNFYQPKYNPHNDRRRAWFTYKGEGVYGLEDGKVYSYKCLRAASGLHLECLRTRIRDENLGNPKVSNWLVTDFTLRSSQRTPFGITKDKAPNRRDAVRAEKINRCIGASESMSQAWLKKPLLKGSC
tara:strand:- start:360 stop:746 length:387 start_codon:yes stop_codon:yes gene_type:complete